VACTAARSSGTFSAPPVRALTAVPVSNTSITGAAGRCQDWLQQCLQGVGMQRLSTSLGATACRSAGST
jgi:hypothetical protein